MSRSIIQDCIQESINTKARILADENLLLCIQKVVDCCVNAYQNDKKILFCGNGGSAGDAQHIAAELSGRFYKNRRPLYAEALHVNSSYMTAVGNDYGYDEVYRRMVEAAGRKGDILFAISTSGNSENVMRAIAQAQVQGMIVVAMTGESGGKMATCCDYLLNVPSTDTPRIQESHILIGHILCLLIEEEMFK
jgi:D-sedoheptulose 7-phosphate isomerase